ncbi:MAG: hypothetical protein QOC67_4054 [Pseudonocardiales bacterium]|jgi:hypothetical protein|nr:hypothetical protein [Pseudonocardiales bacterium]MDT7591984.1 hypothetical protein [Pseudonocardiales bacterium]MDT7606009.1 hypothetical protein [Pseudonocardiales bacterium]MDT7666752.1 hypothetical protein [Pseudonocardiales bacterium]MDT7747681.1 hypothetical protein [Pseudonocardiales bacterium]
MSLIRKLAALGVAAEAARRYAQKNPQKARELTEKAASFADQRTGGKYHGQIESARRKLADLGGYAAPEPPLTAQAVITPAEPRPAPPTPYKRG